MNIAGRFSRVSRGDDKNALVLVGFIGDVYQHNLTPENINYIKAFYNRAGWEHKFFAEWPVEIEPAYQAAKNNFKNGFMLIYK